MHVKNVRDCQRGMLVSDSFLVSSDFPRCKAVKFIEQGHVRVGPDTITDPAFLVTRLFSFLSYCLISHRDFSTDTWKTL